MNESTAIILPPGEATKSYRHLESLCDRVLAAGIERRDPIIAFGGGVIGDLAGFAAACYLRGVPFIQIPTTLPIARADHNDVVYRTEREKFEAIVADVVRKEQVDTSQYSGLWVIGEHRDGNGAQVAALLAPGGALVIERSSRDPQPVVTVSGGALGAQVIEPHCSCPVVVELEDHSGIIFHFAVSRESHV